MLPESTWSAPAEDAVRNNPSLKVQRQNVVVKQVNWFPIWIGQWEGDSGMKCLYTFVSGTLQK